MISSDGARVLVADDDRDIRQSVAEILRIDGYQVTQASDGQEALDKLADSEVDAVLLDIKMPRKDGISVLDDMNPVPPPPGVVLVSAYDLDRETRSRLGKRVLRILRKPVPPPELLKAVSEAVQVSRSTKNT